MTGIDVSIGPHFWQFTVRDLGDYQMLLDEIRTKIDDPSVHAIKHRFSKTQDSAYLSNGCTHCDALIGAFYEHEAWDGQRPLISFDRIIDGQWLRALRSRSGFRPAWGVYDAGPPSGGVK